jgi:hypothetical protein
MTSVVELVEVIRDLDLHGLDDAIGVVRARALLDAKAAEVIGQVDHDKDWMLDGHSSMAACLRADAGIGFGEGRRLSRRAEVLRDLPMTTAAWVEGTLDSGQVDLIVAIVTDRTRPLLAETEDQVLSLLIGCSHRQTKRLLGYWQARAEAILAVDDPEAGDPGDPPQSLHVSETGGRGAVDGDLDLVTLELLKAALRLAERRDDEGEDRQPSQRRADALADLCRWFLDHHGVKHTAGRHRPHLNLVIQQEDLERQQPGETIGGQVLDQATMQQVACDSVIHRVLMRDSEILDYGRATRTIPPAVYTSLVLRDLGCRFPGCDRKPEWCEGHHVWHWEDGGPTCLTNLVLLCSYHHHLIHRPGWEIKLLPHGTVEVTKPDGTTLSGDPPHRW